MSIKTDNEMKANKPDVVLKDKREISCPLDYMSVSDERNIFLKTTEKFSNYNDPEIKIDSLWNMKTIAIPVIIGGLSLIKKAMGKYIKKLLAASRYKSMRLPSSPILTY